MGPGLQGFRHSPRRSVDVRRGVGKAPAASLISLTVKILNRNPVGLFLRHARSRTPRLYIASDRDCGRGSDQDGVRVRFFGLLDRISRVRMVIPDSRRRRFRLTFGRAEDFGGLDGGDMGSGFLVAPGPTLLVGCRTIRGPDPKPEGFTPSVD